MCLAVFKGSVGRAPLHLLQELQSVERKWRGGIYWRNPIFHSHLHCAHDSSLVPKAPAHLRLLLTPALVSWLCSFRSDGRPDGDLGNLSAFTEAHTKAADLRWTRKGLRMHEDGEACEALGGEVEEDGHEDMTDDATKELPNPGEGLVPPVDTLLKQSRVLGR